MGKPLIPVILAGGSGTRLWPLSRMLYPKQYLPLVDENSMLLDTLLRIQQMSSAAAPIVICNEEHRFIVAEQLRSKDISPSGILLEPVGRNTAPAIAVCALHALSVEPDATLAVLPADHHITAPEALSEAMETAMLLADNGRLVTFGIVPQTPETGYGYIKQGVPVDSVQPPPTPSFEIAQFVEKPDAKTARSYLDSGEYLWNSGMFVFRADVFLQELEKHQPEMVAACRKAYEQGASDLDFYRLDKDAFDACPSDSVDYAVMQKTALGAVTPLDAGWSDVGSWDALWDVKEKNEDGNVCIGDVLTKDVNNSYLHSMGRLLAVVGVEEHVIVETPDAVMVSPKDKVQDVKLLVDKLKEQGREEAVLHKKVYRPWGAYESINIDDRFQVKRISVKPGAKLSLQKHYHRAEHWVVVQGTAIVTRGDKEIVLKEDESTYIPLGYIHRLENPGKIMLELIEVQTGSYLGEDDIVRTDDVYGR